jgi:hypothetical protein
MSAEISEPVLRRSIMRLGLPRIKSLQSDDGTASLTFQGADPNRDTGGLVYVFRLKTPSGDAEVHATVGIVTGFPAAEKYGAESGNRLWDLSPADARAYVETYAGEYGNTFEVRIFKVPVNASDDSIVVLRDAFCDLFLKFWSSYRYSNADETSDPVDCYPDTINFVPHDVDKKFLVTLHARQAGRHD